MNKPLINSYQEIIDFFNALSPFLVNLFYIVLIFFVSILSCWIAKKIVMRIITKIVNSTKMKWDNIFLEKKVFDKLVLIIPALVIYLGSSYFSDYQEWVRKIIQSYFIFIGLISVNAVFNALEDIYKHFEFSKNRPIKGYIQLVMIFLSVLGVISIISIFLNQSPWRLISGIGALTALVLLVFKDSILGFVASIQMAANNMVQIGDWIEFPRYNADGDIIDITLNTVKVQNWDKTITTIPTYALVSDAFKNWRGMSEAGGRRIKRAVYIDISSIRFCDQEMLEKLGRFKLLQDYLANKQKELEAFHKQVQVGPDDIYNSRRLTNIGTFRIYIREYLKKHPHINQGLTQLVRHLQPTEHGLPVQVYAFTNDTAWARYEEIQADIFDHIFSIMPEFGLVAFQNPTGRDFGKMMQ